VRVSRVGSSLDVRLAGERLFAREACGLVLAWFPRGSPTFDLPWQRLMDPSWHYVSPLVHTVAVHHERPFADYFDHWHTRHVHQIPYEIQDIWFDGPRCGVSWKSELTPLHLDRFHRSFPKLVVSSSATLYGLGFAVDELSQGSLRFVNVQSNTPVDDTSIEQTIIVGIRTPRLARPLAGAVASMLRRSIRKEIALDIAYWQRCARSDVRRDDESTRDMTRFREWCAAL
jgi:3-Ketosteroid 9alpha-hydroxylase C-terminal domain